MSLIRYVKEPGYINDLLFVFVLQHNEEPMIQRFVNLEKGSEDVNFYMRTMNIFPKSSVISRLFFYLMEGRAAFITQYYFNCYADMFDGGYDFKFLCGKLADTDLLRENIIRFYFNVGDGEISEWAGLTLSELSLRIFRLKLPDQIKNLLTMFFIDPSLFSKRLIDDLCAAEPVLADYYESNGSVISEMCDSVRLQDDTINASEGVFSDFKGRKCDFFSCSIVAVNNFKSLNSGDGMTFILGRNGLEFWKYTNKIHSDVRLDKFGKILSEPNRLEILRMLAESGELYTSEIAKKLSISVTAAYYHMEMMEEAKMVRSRSEGRTVYFHINYRYFDNAANVLRRLIRKKPDAIKITVSPDGSR